MQSDKPPLATSDFPAEHQAEAVAVANIQIATHAMVKDISKLTDYHRERLIKIVGEIIDITGERRGELESIAYTAQNPIPPFKRMY